MTAALGPEGRQRGGDEPRPPARLLHTDADIVLLVRTDGQLLAASPTAAVVLGDDLERVVGRPLCEGLHPEDAGLVRALAQRLGRDGRVRAVVRLHRADHLPVWLDVAGKDVGDGTAYVSARDVTDDVLATAHLAASEQQWRVAFEHSPVGGALLDPTGALLLVNDALTEMLGHRPEELGRLTLQELTLPEDWEAESTRWSALVAGRIREYTTDRRYRTVDGRVVWGRLTAASLLDEDASVRHVMIALQDITERRDAELQLANRALHDGLTGLPNRFLTRQWLASALEEHPGQGVGLLYCDLDRFKVVNDSLGHGAGDELLVEAALRIRDAMPEDALVGRVGGDEFVVVVEGLSEPDALRELAARVSAALDDPIALRGHQHAVTMSMGAVVGRLPDSADQVLMQADMALLRAKRLGRARVELFEPGVDRIATRDDLELEDHLRRSVQSDELRAYYQPIVLLDGRQVVGYESLLRWQHPDRGLLPPDRFLDLAESSGLIRHIGWWMLRRACSDTAAMDAAATGTAGTGAGDRALSLALPWVAVNASPSQLARLGVVDRVRHALDVSGLRPERLHLEITETALMQASNALVAELSELSEMGVRVVLDDFGTGYSSLSLLRDLPVDMVKIDRSFVAPLLTDRSAEAIVRAVLGICSDLGLPTVAEGVETEEQAARLLELRCSHAQGFLFGRPVPLAGGSPGAGVSP